MRNILPGILIAAFLAAAIPCQAQQQRRAPEIRGKVWYNTIAYKKRPTLKALRGKVVLLFFWTMDDPACEDTAIRLNSWYIESRTKGLEIIGVHTPEWEFNKSESALYKKIDKLGLLYPVVVDNVSAIRDEYGHQAWPAFALIDRDGYIRASYEGINQFRQMKIMLDGLIEESGRQPRINRGIEEK